MEISRKIEIKYNWWNEDIKEIPYEVMERLEGEAEQRIFEMRNQGYTSGELNSNIDNIEYRGWFEINYV